MAQSITDSSTLHNGIEMPWLGLGVFLTDDGEPVKNAVRWALETGYRSIDTAAIYGNERGVGEAIADGDIPREKIFVTTKVWNSEQGYDETLSAFDESLTRLKMEYVDLYLVHWPVKQKYKDTWRAMEEIYRSGRAKAIGVSNFLVHHLEDLLEEADIVPMVDQEAWRPIMRGDVESIPEIKSLAQKYKKTGVQVTLRWMIQKEIVTIPKSENRERIRSNAKVFDFELTEHEMSVIDGLDREERLGEHPDHFRF